MSQVGDGAAPAIPAIRIQSLHKAFGDRPAITDISLEVARGEIFGLLGHNGAGKSTTLGILLGMVAPDRGQTFVGGDPVQTRRAAALSKVGAIFETPCFYDYLSGWDNLLFFVSLSGVMPPREECLRVVGMVGLQDRIHDKVRTYSHGMRQRLGLAQALLPHPEVLILDEPTDGLDPLGIHEMRALIRHLRDTEGITVILSSHLLSEVEQLCDRIAILHEGRMLFSGRWGGGETLYRFSGAPDELLQSTLLDLGLKRSAQLWVVPTDFDPAGAVAALVAAGVRVSEVTPCPQTLEDFYMEAVGR